MDDLQVKTNSVHLRIMEVVAYSFVLIYAAITVSAILSNEKDLLSSMKDATVNIAMIIIGYIFGSSAGSKTKSSVPPNPPDTQPVAVPPQPPQEPKP